MIDKKQPLSQNKFYEMITNTSSRNDYFRFKISQSTSDGVVIHSFVLVLSFQGASLCSRGSSEQWWHLLWAGPHFWASSLMQLKQQSRELQHLIFFASGNRASSAVGSVLRSGAQGPGFEPGLFYNAQYVPSLFASLAVWIELFFLPVAKHSWQRGREERREGGREGEREEGGRR